MSAKIWILKFYDSQENYDNKNPFHTTEFIGEEADAKKQAEAIKADIKAHSYKMKEREI